jgi:site-specific recombinase XerD
MRSEHVRALLEDIEPITVAAYIKTLQSQAAAPTVKQHMAAIRMLFSWLTEKRCFGHESAREVKTDGPAKGRRLVLDLLGPGVLARGAACILL